MTKTHVTFDYAALDALDDAIAEWVRDYYPEYEALRGEYEGYDTGIYLAVRAVIDILARARLDAQGG